MIRVNVFILAKEGCREELLAIGNELVEKTLPEAGCIAYDLFESTTRKDVFMICETWADEATLAAHEATPHFNSLVPKLQEVATLKLEKFTSKEVIYPLSSMSLSTHYTEYIKRGETELNRLEHTSTRLYLLRLTTFLLFVSFQALYFAYDRPLIYMLISLSAFAGFMHSVIRDIKLVKRKRYLTQEIAVNREELASLEHRYEQRKRGEQYKRLNPHLSDDFDLFGERSLFQYLNRCATLRGEELLATRLVESTLDSNLILHRQEAIKELSTHLNLLLTFQTHGRFVHEQGNEIRNLIRWARNEDKKATRLKAIGLIVVLINLTGLTLILLGVVSAHYFMLPILLNMALIYTNQRKINQAHHQLGTLSKILKQYLPLFKLIDKEHFLATLLVEEKKRLRNGQENTLKSLAKLIVLTKNFDVRDNQIVSVVLNLLVGFDFHTYYELIQWKKRNSAYLEQWFGALAEFDCLISYAQYAANNSQQCCYPQLTNGQFTYQATQLGHPLLPVSKRINNDVTLGGEPSVTIITGANMAGKSTFLRTIAANLILATNGAPVVAQSMTFTPCHLISSIKIQDSLADGKSYFYAELLRLKEILDYTTANPQTLVILDEILRGTNTKDKQLGSIGYLEKLIAGRAKVMIATHDLVIGRLEEKYPSCVKNHCFEVELIDDQLHFDYKLKAGISQKLNASHLMKKMGITE